METSGESSISTRLRPRCTTAAECERETSKEKQKIQEKFVFGVGDFNETNGKIIEYLEGDETRCHEYLKINEALFYCRGCYEIDPSTKIIAKLNKYVYLFPVNHICKALLLEEVQKNQQIIKQRYDGISDTQQQRRPQSHMNNDGDLVYGDDIEMDDVDEPVGAESTIKHVQENAMVLPEIPFDDDYDPVESVPPHKAVNVVAEMHEKYQTLFYQPNISDNYVRVPVMKDFEENKFYFFEITDLQKKNQLTEAIRRLGGTVVSQLYNATKVLFNPISTEMVEASLFLFLTAAIGGRYLLPVSYIFDSSNKNEFLDVHQYSTNNYYKAKEDIHESTMAAIKISNQFRKQYAKNKNPRFHLYNILLAVKRSQEDDVNLLLQILGAYVQPCHDNNQYLTNPLYTLCVTDGNIKLSEKAKLIPRTTPQQIRNILWNTYREYLSSP